MGLEEKSINEFPLPNWTFPIESYVFNAISL